MHVLERAVAINSKSNRTVHGARGAGGGINCPLLPIAINSVLHRFDVPAIAGGEIGASLALNGDAARTGAGGLRIAGGEIRTATLTVVNVVVVNNCRILVGSGFSRRGQGFLFCEGRNFRSVGLRLGWFLGFFLMKAFCWINRLAFGYDRFFRHGDSGGTDQTDFCASELPPNAPPRVTLYSIITRHDTYIALAA